MRTALTLAALLLAGCEQASNSTGPQASPGLTAGEERLRIDPPGEPAATLRSGAEVPVSLPPGFTLYPAAKVVANTRVERGRQERVLLVFETPDPLEKVMLFYRAQARAAGVALTVDLGREERASLAGHTASGLAFALTAGREGGATRAELSFGPLS